MSQKKRQKWVFFYRRVLLFHNKKAYFKKGLLGALHLDMLFQTKTKIKRTE